MPVRNLHELPIEFAELSQAALSGFITSQTKHEIVSRKTGVGKCPMTWEYWTSPEIVAIKKTIYRSWLGDVKHGDI